MFDVLTFGKLFAISCIVRSWSPSFGGNKFKIQACYRRDIWIDVLYGVFFHRVFIIILGCGDVT